IPENLEMPKVIATTVYAPRMVRVRGTYDDVNRRCAQLADRFGWGIVNVNLRGYYGEGSKTVAYEIMEQLGWRLPTAVVAPMAGGSLVTKLRKGFGEFQDAGLVHGVLPRLYGAQPSGCAPIVRLVERGGTRIEPEVPDTICRSLAIGNPADGPFAARALLESGGWAAAVSDAELVQAIRFLAEDSGVFAETAGGVTAAAALALARPGRRRGDAVADVAARYPALGPRLRDKDGNPYPFVVFYVNDEDVRFRGGFAAPVRDGDEVTVIPAIAGG